MSLIAEIAVRHLRSGMRQTSLTVGVVTISVMVMVVLGGLIGGVQRRLLDSITGSIAHVTIQQGPRTPRTPDDAAGGLVVPSLVPIENTQRKIEDWRQLVDDLPGRIAGVRGVSPTVGGSGFLWRGARRKSVSITGVDPVRHDRLFTIESKLTAGRFLGLSSGECAVGARLADDLHLSVGDKVRLTGSEGQSVGFTVAGIFDSGSPGDAGTVLTTLRDAQMLMGLGNAVTSIAIKLEDVYAADRVADDLTASVPYEVRSWMRDNAGMLTGLKAQSIFSFMIRLSTVVAAAFSIAAILFNAVTSRRREIGILKALGATRGLIGAVFALEGLLIGVIGAVIGTTSGVLICLYMAGITVQSRFSGKLEPMFPLRYDFDMVGVPAIVAVLIGLLAALYPAWQAARVDPIEVIRSA